MRSQQFYFHIERFLNADKFEQSGDQFAMLRILVNTTINATVGNKSASEEGDSASKSSMGWQNILLLILLVMLSAYSNGMNIGVMGLDVQQLEVMSNGPYENKEDEKDGEMAKKLLPIRQKGLQLLVTILLGCAITNSAVSILLAEAEGDLSGFFISTVLTLMFGEIIP